MKWSSIFALIFLPWTLWSAISLIVNYRKARKIGLPIIVSPVSSLNTLWLLTYIFLPIIPLLQKLPSRLGEWTKYAYIGWQYDDGYKTHVKMGPTFVLCTPAANEVVVADADTARSILARRKEFTKPLLNYQSLNVFGPNLVSSQGSTWQRHRKITAPNFNERVSSSVWTEALHQSEGMLKQWAGFGEEGTSEVAADSATLALHVLTSAGLGISYAFTSREQQLGAHHQLSYRDALLIVLRNFIILSVVPRRAMKYRFMPKSMRQIAEACDEFELYMVEQVRDGKGLIGQSVEKNNLLSSLVRASSERTPTAIVNARPADLLTDDELFGNLFIYNLAGHETTASTVATAIVYLAASPHWQEWISDEVNSCISRSGRASTWEYASTFPKLKRCLAVMLETLRLHGAVVSLPREAYQTERALRIDDHEYMIPANTQVSVNFQALHSDPKTWGPDALHWRPDRWIRKSVGGKEELLEPREGSFLAWSDGPRLCPGKKFSQVEFAAVMATLFHRYRVRPVLKTNETIEGGQQRLKRMIDDSGIFAVTLQMRNPKAVNLVWSLADTSYPK